MEAHRGLDPAVSRRLDAKLVIRLANHIGDAEVLREAIRLARADGGEGEAGLAPAGIGQRPAACRSKRGHSASVNPAGHASAHAAEGTV